MFLWPSKQQWQGWSLPSKLTAIGACVGIIALGFYVVEKIIQIIKPDKQGEEVREIHALLREQFKINDDDLSKKYSFGFGLFYANKVAITSFNDVTKFLDIDWKPAKIVLLSENELEMNAPSVVYYTNQSDRSKPIEFTGFFIRMPRIESLTVELQAGKELQISMGVLVNRKDYVVGVIGVGKPE